MAASRFFVGFEETVHFSLALEAIVVRVMGTYVSISKGTKYTVAAQSSIALEPTSDMNKSVTTMPIVQNVLHEIRQFMKILYCRPTKTRQITSESRRYHSLTLQKHPQ